ncbi:MAG TPA: S-layer homology domain-containing protein, partial [Chloroflexia bacterium]|nr:S-layer homology domain-containing protein [Chloroflexia bacterium]
MKPSISRPRAAHNGIAASNAPRHRGVRGWGALVLTGALALAALASPGVLSAGQPSGERTDRAATQFAAPGAQEGRTADPREGAQPEGAQAFADVPESNPFYFNVQNIYNDGIVNGYPCGGPGEPCDVENRPYYRPGGSVTRAQMAKFTDLARKNATIDVYTANRPYAIRGTSDAPAGLGLAGRTGGTGTRNANEINAGTYGYGSGTSSSTVGSIGVLGVSQNDNGAWLLSNSGTYYGLYVQRNGARFERNNAGWIGATVYVDGQLQVTGGCTGCALNQIMVNTSDADLHVGDVVVLEAGAAAAAEVNGTPAAGVEAAAEAYNSGVVGVVTGGYTLGDESAAEGSAARSGGPNESVKTIAPGRYMTVATEGVVKMVKADATAAPIRTGDLLTTSGSAAGAAMKVADKAQAFGAVLGKALGNLESGTG